MTLRCKGFLNCRVPFERVVIHSLEIEVISFASSFITYTNINFSVSPVLYNWLLSTGITIMTRAQSSHPLDPLSAAEIAVAVTTVRAAGSTPEVGSHCGTNHRSILFFIHYHGYYYSELCSVFLTG